jgi:hypothetical protein
MNVAYHYTDASGVLGILTSMELWATDIRFLNDQTELSYGIDIAQQVLDRFREISGTSQRQIAYLSKTVRDFGLGRHSVAKYAVSLAGDGDLMSQWRGYGSFGSGYALGFDVDSLRSITTLDCKPILYAVDDVASVVEDIIIQYLAEVETVPTGSAERGAIVRRAAEACVQSALYAKHPAFTEEHELRLTITSDAPKHRVRGDQIISYVPINIGDGEIIPSLVRIILGPSTTMLSAVGISEYLASLGYPDHSVELSLSGIPFRKVT